MLFVIGSIALLILVTLGVAIYQSFVKKKMVEHYYTPFDHIFGQTQVEYHTEKVEKKEEEEGEGDDKDKNRRIASTTV
ncbi:DUF3951 domain-containing protein [Brevibacillus fluminis]|nr:DUF3951 domain-containing protein [Brevibacillus fluminis]